MRIEIDDLRAVLTSIIADEKTNQSLDKPQLTFTEACKLYGGTRIRKYIKSGLLKTAAQNGRGTAKYYCHKRIIWLTQQSFHNQKNVQL